MKAAFLALATLLVLSTAIPFLSCQHWTVRWLDFAKIQFTVLGGVTLIFGLFCIPRSIEVSAMLGLLLISQLYNISVLIPYTKFYRVKRGAISEVHSKSVTILSANVLQFNERYDQFLELVAQAQPDIVLTMESNSDWDSALGSLESQYCYRCKIPLENTYGMHLYSKLAMKSQIHYFVTDDIPSIEAELFTQDGYRFRLFCLHPPPPSPTEEPNSKERDGELLSVAKRVRQQEGAAVVVGDFNTVVWSRASVLFRKTSETIDPRMGRGLTPTFHAKSRFLRIPIDQIYHTADISVRNLSTLPYFGSDHFPLFFEFVINSTDTQQKDLVSKLEPGEEREIEELIQRGIEEEGEREAVATETKLPGSANSFVAIAFEKLSQSYPS